MCGNCRDIIESVFIHHLVYCCCGKVSIEGGKHFLKRYGTNIIEMSETYEMEI